MTEPDRIDWESLEGQYQLTFELSQRRLEGQELTFDALRGRAVNLIAVASAITAFVAGIIFGDSASGPIGWLTVAALVFYGATVAACLRTLWSVDWRARPKGSDVVESYVERHEGPAGMAEMYRGLAVDMQNAWSDNEPTLTSRMGWLQAAIILTVITTALWLVELVLSR